jgi:hypothetical protein
MENRGDKLFQGFVSFPVTLALKVGSCISVISRSTAATLLSGHAFCDHDMADTGPIKAI